MASQETTAIIQYLKDAGVYGIVTATTNGKHAPGSFHKKYGTGGQGLAVDFGLPGDKAGNPGYRTIFDAFLLVETQLAELIYTPAPFSIDNGKRIGTQGNHLTHVHVAVPKGTIIKWPGTPIINVPTEPFRGDWMPKNADRMAICANAKGPGYYEVFWDGGVANYGGAPFCGSAGHIPEHVQGRRFTGIVSLEEGEHYYGIMATDGATYWFGPKEAAKFGLPKPN